MLAAALFLLVLGCGRDKEARETPPPPEPAAEPAPDSFVVAPPGPPDTIIHPQHPRKAKGPK